MIGSIFCRYRLVLNLRCAFNVAQAHVWICWILNDLEKVDGNWGEKGEREKGKVAKREMLYENRKISEIRNASQYAEYRLVTLTIPCDRGTVR